ncbi:alpha/beta hydrolase [Saccharopolyspora gloriosae]|uniref:Pimeloyl-ACP methyl ester carboxylesterase n=1 Tax=Saccharopolyspora gloriosae TaxID=455344 RepID=A0A840NS29_9PSEU|nr:alpha/beta fold hydrolase [Saccharopolyspora gloriosae]MBB5071952.1 pimeloyl-ACP methyl ester carboxylesterase [Saccharopolyspora gloriosae]
MIRTGKASALIALCCAVAGAGLAGCGDGARAGSIPGAEALLDDEDLFTGAKKFDVDGRSVNVSCSGVAVPGRPVVVLLHGGGDGLDAMADLQRTLGEKGRTCSYDRLGAGASDRPDGPQTFEDSGKVLTGVIDRVGVGEPVVLAGHSLGGLISARYAPEHPDEVAGVVLLDATSPTQTADLEREIPADATGPAAELRDQSLAIFRGENPERLVMPDGEVASAGDIPIEVIQHGKQYLAAVPEYGPGLESAWAAGQQQWRALSTRSEASTAVNSEHYIYRDEPAVVVRAIDRVVAQAAEDELFG